jgi:acyl carrier protein
MPRRQTFRTRLKAACAGTIIILAPTTVMRDQGTAMADVLHENIRNFILENYLFTTDTSAIGMDDSLLDRGIVDSTGMLEVIFFIEEQLGVKVRDEEMVPENLDSVNRIASFVLSKRQAAA